MISGIDFVFLIFHISLCIKEENLSNIEIYIVVDYQVLDWSGQVKRRSTSFLSYSEQTLRSQSSHIHCLLYLFLLLFSCSILIADRFNLEHLSVKELVKRDSLSPPPRPISD